MKIIDLTHSINSNMPVFPGTERPIFEIANTLEKDGFIENKITMYSHTGTHIDAPAHMIKDGLFLDEYPADHFYGSAYIVDLTNIKSKIVDVEEIKHHEEKIKCVDFVILKTGWSKTWGEDEYFIDFPTLSVDAAIYLSKFNLKGIGVDTISVDDITSSSFDIHKILLGRKFILIENLTNLELVDDNTFIFMCMPLKTERADGSPTRAIALIND
ncbi:Kynurenine formamidase [Alkalithermobacter thermoalcaliphilus JW-YL-7 = DSM 7308]|uniref:Kynurenine formamidase n=1 Tax=Alkalithermobacter thermoalcaliphilus JW-YL-7 = DSM 7308 TaxID=1121328 RepID=A0A150FQJ6_CLOPD|nr:cyclase family protein [[Clostridium] paradoxum JW-YL-7 = DSM 7308]SHK78096.1 Kynurenine formamidase [[Clostridium] paradoxum JW-YL-7 = DSM 7308]